MGANVLAPACVVWGTTEELSAQLCSHWLKKLGGGESSSAVLLSREGLSCIPVKANRLILPFAGGQLCDSAGSSWANNQASAHRNRHCASIPRGPLQWLLIRRFLCYKWSSFFIEMQTDEGGELKLICLCLHYLLRSARTTDAYLTETAQGCFCPSRSLMIFIFYLTHLCVWAHSLSSQLVWAKPEQSITLILL